MAQNETANDSPKPEASEKSSRKNNRPSDTLVERAWQLYATHAAVLETPLFENTHLAERCFDAAEAFEEAAKARK